jgi:DNA (cytosine-5)-methyltransferase 1
MSLVKFPLEEGGGHYEKVRAFLRKWGVIGPDEEAEVVIDGVRLRIVDIGLRMLRPRELFLANGFPPDYIINPMYKGKPLTITSQVKKCGNAVPPQFVTAVFTANKCALAYSRHQMPLHKKHAEHSVCA